MKESMHIRGRRFLDFQYLTTEFGLEKELRQKLKRRFSVSVLGKKVPKNRSFGFIFL
jgi:hypothetical protein